MIHSRKRCSRTETLLIRSQRYLLPSLCSLALFRTCYLFSQANSDSTTTGTASWTTEGRQWLIVDPGNTTSGPNTPAPSPLSWLETRSGFKTSQGYSPVDGTNSASSLRLNSSTYTGFACSDLAMPPYGTENSSASALPPFPWWSPHFRTSVLLRYIPLCPTK